MATAHSVGLTCHPWTPGAAVRRIGVRVRRCGAEALALTFSLDGDLRCIRVPPPRAPRIGTHLWAHTCFEAFVAVDGAPAYHEFNFAPSGEWAVFAFRRYRQGAAVADQALAPDINVRGREDGLELDARVWLDELSPEHPRAALRLGLSAVIEQTDGTRSYWALRHPRGQPDFHHGDARALRLEPFAPE